MEDARDKTFKYRGKRARVSSIDISSAPSPSGAYTRVRPPLSFFFALLASDVDEDPVPFRDIETVDILEAP